MTAAITMFAPTLALPAHYPPGLTDVGTALSQVSHHFKQVKVFFSFFLPSFIYFIIIINNFFAYATPGG